MSNFAPIFSPRRSLLELSSPNLHALSPFQSQVDGLVGGFVAQATDWRSLAAMTAGGFAYRVGRIGMMGLGSGNVLRVASVGVGLSAEVSAFELTHRGLLSAGAQGSAPHHANLWSWNGPGGLRQGLLHSFVTFSTLKGGGRLAAGENLVMRHLLQDTAMVAGHQISGALEITPRPTGTLAEQFLHAEATNLQLGAGMALAHGMAPGLHGLERGLDLSLRSPDVGTRFPRLGEGPLGQAAFAAAGVRQSGESEAGLGRRFILNMAAQGNDGSGGGNKEPPRVTLPQVSAGRAEVPPARRTTGSYRQTWIPRIEGVPEDARYIPLKGPSSDPLKSITEAVEAALAERAEPLIVTYDEPGLSSRVDPLRMIRIDMHRTLIGRPEMEGVPVAVALPSRNAATVFRKRGNLVESRDVSLEPAVERSSDRETTAKIPAERAARTTPGATPGVISAINPVKVVEAVARAVSHPHPSVRYTGSLWRKREDVSFLTTILQTRHPLPPDKTLTLELEKASRRFVFFWESGRIEFREETTTEGRASRSPSRPGSDLAPPAAAVRRPSQSGLVSPYARTEPKVSVAEKPSSSLPPPRPSPGPSGESAHDHRLDSLVCQTSAQVMRALESILIHTDPAAVQAPVIRITQGRVGLTELFDYADLIGAFPMRERQRITIAWMEKGGGRLVLDRQGDRVNAELVGKYGVVEGRFVLLPFGPKATKLTAYDPFSIQEYPFQGRSDYEQESDARVLELIRAAFPTRAENAPPLADRRLEGASLRGVLLARTAAEILKPYERSNSPLLSETDSNRLKEIHRLLERAYTFLDFSVLENFSQTLSPIYLSLYEGKIDGINRLAESEKGTLFVPLQDLALGLEGMSYLPGREHLRAAFLGHAFSESTRTRSPRENLLMLRDPVRMGHLFSRIFETYMRAMLDTMDRLTALKPNESLRQILEAPDTSDANLGTIREEFWIRAQDLADYQRLLLGKSNFHRTYLRQAFRRQGDLRTLYENYRLKAAQGPAKVAQELALPSLEQIDRYTRYPSSP